MKKIITLVAVAFLFIGNSWAQKDEAYSKALQTMFKVSGSEEAYQAAIKQMFGMFKTQSPNVSEALWNELENEFSKTSILDLVEMMTPVYKKYLTLADIDEMIKFYSTPVGQKYAKSTPLIMQESMQIGQEWGMKLGEKVAEKMKEKGIEY